MQLFQNFSATKTCPTHHPSYYCRISCSEMTEEQLREMEGSERRSVEARIECLRNINLLLEAAMMQIQQYMDVVPNAGRSMGVVVEIDLIETT